MEQAVVEYVVGFVFSPDLQRVALIRKTHPEWMAGKLNGAGGLRHLGEDSGESMVREASEELGLESKPYDWLYFGRINANQRKSNQGYLVHCFAICCNLDELWSRTKESMEILQVSEIYPGRPDLVAHVDWLIPMSVSQLAEDYTLQLEAWSDPR